MSQSLVNRLIAFLKKPDALQYDSGNRRCKIPMTIMRRAKQPMRCPKRIQRPKRGSVCRRTAHSDPRRAEARPTPGFAPGRSRHAGRAAVQRPDGLRNPLQSRRPDALLHRARPPRPLRALHRSCSRPSRRVSGAQFRANLNYFGELQDDNTPSAMVWPLGSATK